MTPPLENPLGSLLPTKQTLNSLVGLQNYKPPCPAWTSCSRHVVWWLHPAWSCIFFSVVTLYHSVASAKQTLGRHFPKIPQTGCKLFWKLYSQETLEIKAITRRIKNICHVTFVQIFHLLRNGKWTINQLCLLRFQLMYQITLERKERDLEVNLSYQGASNPRRGGKSCK